MGKTSDAQKRATVKFRKEHCKRFDTTFYPADLELYNHLQAQPNKQGYIKQLIREDYEKHHKSED